MRDASTEALLAQIAERQEEKAEALQDTFRGWSTPMLQARISILEGWHTIEALTHGDANYNTISYGSAPYINNDDEQWGLDNVWDIQREIARRDKAGQ
jgi:hypothetical protein